MTDRWIEVGPGVLARRHRELDLTTGLVLGDTSALVIDTGGDHRQGAALAAAVREVTALPLVVAITHAHFDHCFGTGAFPGAPVHAHGACIAAIAATADAQRTEWAAHYGQGDRARALTETRPPLPDHPLPPTGRRELDLGGRTVVLLHPGRGHTDHDVVVHVPDADVVFAGDLLEQGAPPSVGTDSVLGEWPGTLAVLLELDARMFVPGHGEVLDTAAVTAQRDELDSMRKASG